jgi:shikimate kinase
VNSAHSIVLIGMMGAGKSSVGRCLQKRTGLALFDMDEMVAARFGSSISRIFEIHGEEKFRDAETEMLRGLVLNRSAGQTDSSCGEQSIVVSGGGIVLREENGDLLRRLGTIVWLDAEEEILFERASTKGSRPLLETENPRKTFSHLLEARRPLYAKIADVRVDTSGRSEEEVVEEILAQIEHLTR